VLLTPHIAGWTGEALHRVLSTVAEDVDGVLSGASRPEVRQLSCPAARFDVKRCGNGGDCRASLAMIVVY
jgi:hypothetical protein